jgi:hypothetical protein
MNSCNTITKCTKHFPKLNNALVISAHGVWANGMGKKNLIAIIMKYL